VSQNMIPSDIVFTSRFGELECSKMVKRITLHSNSPDVNAKKVSLLSVSIDQSLTSTF
jgi:hypothetical protein